MAQKKKTARRTPSKDTKKKLKPEERALHIVMPFILGILALFFALCFIFGEGMTRTVASKLFKLGRSRK